MKYPRTGTRLLRLPRFSSSLLPRAATFETGLLKIITYQPPENLESLQMEEIRQMMSKEPQKQMRWKLTNLEAVEDTLQVSIFYHGGCEFHDRKRTAVTRFPSA